MRKFKVLALLLVGMLAIGTVSAVAAKTKKKKINTTVTAKYVNPNPADPYDPYANAFFKGKAKSRKAFCKKKRKVVVKTKPQGEKVGSDLTNKKGKWKVNASGFSEGRYQVKVKKKTKVKKKGKGKKRKRVKTICKPAKATVKVN